MAEIRPMIYRIQPFDALRGNSVYFSYTGSKQSLENNLEIKDVNSNMIVYSFDFSSFEKVHHIPPNVLRNGLVYTAKVRVKFADGTYSPFSQEVEFRTFKTPVIDITNIDGQGYVYNQDVTFLAQYNQENNEPVKTYRFSLYDENNDLLQSFPIRFPEDQNNLTELVKGLEKGKGYFIECHIETINGVNYSHKEKFIPMYVVPSANGLVSTRNDKEEGFVRVTANLKQITGTRVKSGNRDEVDSAVGGNPPQIVDHYDYINNEWIVIPKDDPVIFKGLDMNRASDFIMKIWCKNIPNNTMFAEISPEGDSGIGIQLWKYRDRVLAVKEYEGIVSRYCSNIVTVPNNVEYMIYMKVIEHRIDLNIKIL